MTRINTVVPKILSDSHLLAEIREIVRVPTLALKKLDANISVDAGDRPYKLGAGHVTFYYDKIAHIYRRHRELCTEAIARGFKDQRKSDDGRWERCRSYPECWNDWYPDDAAIQENLNRLIERINGSKTQPRYYKTTMSKSEYISKYLSRF